MLKDNPIKNNSREELVYYLCDLHNKVNITLKKPIFDCKKAFGFWGGECGCSDKNQDETKKLEIKDERKDALKEGLIVINKKELKEVNKEELKVVMKEEVKIENKALTPV